MKRSTSPPIRSEQEKHPAVETLERVMTSGIVVDRGPIERRRERLFDVSVAGLELLGVEFEIWTYPLLRPERLKTRGKE